MTAKPPTSDSEAEELRQYLDECHLGDVEYPQAMNPMQRETFEAWLLAWHQRQLAERLQAVLDSLPKKLDERMPQKSDRAYDCEYKQALKEVIRTIEQLMSKETS